METRLINSYGSKYYNFYKWDNEKNKLYDYEKEGLLKRILSNRIIETDNESLKIMLDFIEKSLVFLMKYVDVLKNFKNVRWKNR